MKSLPLSPCLAAVMMACSPTGKTFIAPPMTDTGAGTASDAGDGDADRDGDGWPQSQDCDDNNELTNPNMSEIDANWVDDDCDGWVDGRLIARQLEDGWRYDIADVLGVSETEKFDFEDSEDGAELEAKKIM